MESLKQLGNMPVWASNLWHVCVTGSWHTCACVCGLCAQIGLLVRLRLGAGPLLSVAVTLDFSITVVKWAPFQVKRRWPAIYTAENFPKQ